MQNELQQEKVIKKINEIQHKLDNIFFKVDNQELPDQELMLTNIYLDLVLDMVSTIK